MRKKQLHHLWTRLRVVSYWYFLALAVGFAVVAILALRQNNLTAIELRDEVTMTDQANGNVEESLHKLRQFVYGHMNTHLASENGVYPPIQLKYRYERLVAAEKQRVSDANAQIYTDAQAYCDAKYPPGNPLSSRVACNQQYVDSHQAAKEQPIPDGIYKFDFISPVWSPDRAGWSIIAACFFGVAALVRWGLELWFRQQLDI